MKKKQKKSIPWMCPVDPYFFGMNEFEAWKAGRTEEPALSGTEATEPAETKEVQEKLRRWEAKVRPASVIGRLFFN